MLSHTARQTLFGVRLTRWSVAIIIAAGTGGIALLGCASFLGFGGWVPLLLLPLLLLPLLHLLRKIQFGGYVDPFEPVNWVFLYAILGYVISPAYMLWTGSVSYLVHSYGVEERVYLMAVALLYLTIGLVSFYIGYSVGAGRIIGNSFPPFGGTWSERRLRTVVGLYAFVGLACFLVYGSLAGGIPRLYSNPSLRWNIFQGIPAGGYLLWGTRLLPVALYLSFTHHCTVRPSPILWVFGVCVCAVLLAFGGRGVLLGTLVTLMALYCYFKRSFAIRKLSGWVGLIVTLLVVLTVWRGSKSGEDITYIFQGEYFGGLATFMYVLQHVPTDFGPYYGKTFLDLLLFPVPRVLWPEKPVVAGRLILLPVFPDQGGGVGVSLPVELYLNFLLPGVIPGMLLFGITSRATYAYLTKNMTDRGAVLLYSSVFLPWITGLCAADFVTTTVPALQTLLAVGAALLYVTHGQPKRLPTGSHNNGSMSAQPDLRNLPVGDRIPASSHGRGHSPNSPEARTRATPKPSTVG